ncbi:MAG: hypothetical protein Q7J47_04465 [Azoarcus sp.]|nr:hypothetical protein [Azoarcus sp.]
MTSMSNPLIAPDGTVARTVDHATSTAHRVIDKASETLHPGVDHLAAGAHQAVNSLSDATTRTAETLELRGKQLLEAQSRLTAKCCTQVRERPLTSIGIAVAAGWLLGWLLRQR